MVDCLCRQHKNFQHLFYLPRYPEVLIVEIYLHIRLPNTASEVTIPEEWVNNVKQLSSTNAMSWLVQLRVWDDITNNNYARSQSDSKTIEGWSD